MKINFDERVKWLDLDFITISDNEVILEETAREGMAKLKCRLKNLSIAFSTLDKKMCSYVTYKRCADAIIFERQKDRWVLHVIEFKTTVDSSRWLHIKDQFKGAIIQATACMGLLGIKDIDEIKCYTSFRHDRLSTEHNPDPITLKPLVGGKLGNYITIDWLTDKIKFDFLPGIQVSHGKFKLDEKTGYAEVEL